MTKEQRRALAVLIPFTIALMCFWIIDEEAQVSVSHPALPHSQMRPETSLKAQSRLPASVPANLQNAVVTHTNTGPTQPVWKKQLEKNLIVQASGTLKNAEIDKVDSFNWRMGKVDVKVDSIIVKLEHVKGHRSSFRAIVDASNGKILQTWDQPVLDNFDSKTRYGVKVDPRYHND